MTKRKTILRKKAKMSDDTKNPDAKSPTVQEAFSKEIAVPGVDDWGPPPAVSQNDMVIPKILAMQGLSELVTDGKAKLGDFCDSLTGDKLGDLDNPVKFIPFHMEKTWVVFNIVHGKREFVTIEPVTPENESLPWKDGDIERDYCHSYYVLLPDQVKKGNELPYVVSFRRTSAKAGKKLFTCMYVKNRAAKLSPAATAMYLIGKKTKNDHGTFVVMDVRESRPSTAEEIRAAWKWMKTITSGQTKVKVDQGDIVERKDGSDEFGDLPL